MKNGLLREGKMSSKEIAKWLNIGYDTYRQNIPMYLNRLIPYCDYIRTQDGIDIQQVFHATYLGPIMQKDIKIIQQYFKQEQEIQGRKAILLTSEKMGKDIIKYYEEYDLEDAITKAQVLLRSCTIFPEMPLYAIYDEKNNQYIPLTKEEEDILYNIMEKCQYLLDKHTIVGVDYDLYTNNISTEQYAFVMTELYKDYIKEIFKKFKEQVKKPLTACFAYTLKDNLNKKDLNK